MAKVVDLQRYREQRDVAEAVAAMTAPMEVVLCPHCGEYTPAHYQWCVHCRSEWY